MKLVLTRFVFATLMALVAPSAFAHPDAKHSLETLDEHLAASPRDPQLHLAKARVLLGIDHVAEAIRCVDEAASLDSKAAGLGYFEARLFQATGHVEQARKRLESFLKDEPEHAEAIRLVASLCAKADDASAAAWWLQKLLQLPKDLLPDDAARCAALYLHRHQPGDDDLALKVLDDSMASLGCLKGLQYMAIDIEMRLGRHEAALSRLALLTARFRPQVEFELKRAQILEQAGRKAEAAQAYDNAVVIMDGIARERQASPLFQEARLKYLTLRDKLRAL